MTSTPHALDPALPPRPVRGSDPLGESPLATSTPLRRAHSANAVPVTGSDGAQALALLLRQLPLFKLLPDELLSVLAQRAMIRRYGRDDLIVSQDERDPHLFVLLRGRTHLERVGEGGRSVLLGMLGVGDRIGDWSLVDGQPHHANVRCTGTVEALMLRGEDVLRCQSEHLAFSNAWCSALVRQLRDRNQRIMCMSLYGVRERVVWRLKEWAEEDDAGRRVVSNRIGRTELARMVGASREMVCRVLRGLQSAGQVELCRDRRIVLLDGFGD